MKKVISIFTLATGLFFLSVYNQQVFAASCTNVEINPQPVPQRTIATLTATCDTAGSYNVNILDPSGNVHPASNLVNVAEGNLSLSIAIGASDPIGNYTVGIIFAGEVISTINFDVTESTGPNVGVNCCSYSLEAPENMCTQISGQEGTCTTGSPDGCPSICPGQRLGAAQCGGILDSNLYYCTGNEGSYPYLCTNTGQIGIDTAIGCIPFAQPESIAIFFIKWGVRIAGGIAMLTFIAAGFMFITSSGDPEKVKSAQDLFISAISGLLMVIFSIFLLRFIGFNILQIFQ